MLAPGFAEFILICYLPWYFAAFDNQVSMPYKCPHCTRPVQNARPNPSMEKGAGHEVSLLAEELMAIVSSWERKGPFSLTV